MTATVKITKNVAILDSKIEPTPKSRRGG